MCEETIQETWPQLISALQSQGSSTIQSQLIRKDGAAFPVEIAVNPIRFDGTQFICTIIRDITKQKLLENQLRHHAENLDQILAQRTLELAGERVRTRTILEALGEAVLVSDKDLQIQYPIHSISTSITILIIRKRIMQLLVRKFLNRQKANLMYLWPV